MIGLLEYRCVDAFRVWYDVLVGLAAAAMFIHHSTLCLLTLVIYHVTLGFCKKKFYAKRVVKKWADMLLISWALILLPLTKRLFVGTVSETMGVVRGSSPVSWSKSWVGRTQGTSPFTRSCSPVGMWKLMFDGGARGKSGKKDFGGIICSHHGKFTSIFLSTRGWH